MTNTLQNSQDATVFTAAEVRNLNHQTQTMKSILGVCFHCMTVSFSVSFCLWKCVCRCLCVCVLFFPCCLEPHERWTQEVQHPVLGEVQGPTEHMKGTAEEKTKWTTEVETLIPRQSQRFAMTLQTGRPLQKRLWKVPWKAWPSDNAVKLTGQQHGKLLLWSRDSDQLSSGVVFLDF